MIPALRLPTGITTAGHEISIDLLAYPHILITGDTNPAVRKASAALAEAAARTGHTLIPTPPAHALEVLDELVVEAADRRAQLHDAAALHWAGHPDMPPVTVTVENVAGLIHDADPREREHLVHLLTRLTRARGQVGIYLHLTQTATTLPLPEPVQDGVGATVWAGGTGITSYRPGTLGSHGGQAVVTRDGYARCVLHSPVNHRQAA